MFFSEFPKPSSNEWKEQIRKDLKGVDASQLVWKTLNGFDINPFYTKDDLKEHQKQQLFNHTNWDICDYIVVTDEQSANKKALNALNGGASGLVFVINKPVNIEALLENVSVEFIYTQFIITPESLHIIQDLKHVYGKLNTVSKKLNCFITIDPLYSYASSGKWHIDEAHDFEILKQLAHIPVNATFYQEAGANTVNELAITLAHVNEYLHYLSNTKKLIDQTLHVSLSVNTSFFTEIAKIRSFKKLIELLQQSYGVRLPLHIHAQTTQINNSSLDANNNMLRTTTEAMSAVLGGCNSLVVFPYNTVYEPTTDFSSRIARNQQHILKEESYLDKVADVAAGSYYIETLTDTLAEKAWEQFKIIESKGGFIACLKNNFVQELILEDATTIIEKIKLGELTLIGVNKFQNKNEAIKRVDVAKINNSETLEITPINPIRYSLQFERETRTTEQG